MFNLDPGVDVHNCNGIIHYRWPRKKSEFITEGTESTDLTY